MLETDDMTPARRLMTALELVELGKEIRRQQLVRQNPAATDLEILAQLRDWQENSGGSTDVPDGFVPSRRFR